MTITLGFAVSLSCSVDVRSDRAVGVLMDALARVLTVIVIGGLTVIGVDVLVNANANVLFAGVVGAKFATPAPLEGFSC